MFWTKEWFFRQQEAELQEQFQQPAHVRVIPSTHSIEEREKDEEG